MFLYPPGPLIPPVLSPIMLLLSRILVVDYNGHCLFLCFLFFIKLSPCPVDASDLDCCCWLVGGQARTVWGHLKEEVRVEPNSSLNTLPHCSLQLPALYIHQFKIIFSYLGGRGGFSLFKSSWSPYFPLASPVSLAMTLGRKPASDALWAWKSDGPHFLTEQGTPPLEEEGPDRAEPSLAILWLWGHQREFPVECRILVMEAAMPRAMGK